MVAHARKDIVVSDEVSIYHCCCRCVRRAYLCGLDRLTGNDYSYRRDWVRERLENLAACFAVDVATYCVMENHEQSSFTSVADRIADHMAWVEANEEAQEKTLSGWLVPIPIDGDGYAGAADGRRASDKGLFDFSSDNYLELLDWTGRQIRDDKRGAIPRDLEPTFDRLHLHEELWVDRVVSFGHQSCRPASRSSARDDMPDDGRAPVGVAENGHLARRSP